MKENIEKIIESKQQIKCVSNSESAKEILKHMNRLNINLVDTYITFYCEMYIKDIANQYVVSSNKKPNSMYQVLNLIMPNREYKKCNRKLFFDNKEINEFAKNIEDKIEQVKYKMFCRQVSDKKYIKNLIEDYRIYTFGDICRYINRCIDEKSLCIEEYIDFILKEKLDKRIQERIKLKGEKSIVSLINTTIISGGRVIEYMEVEKLYNLIMKRYKKYCEEIVMDRIYTDQSIDNVIGYAMTATRILNIFSELDENIIDKYINYWSQHYYLRYKKDIRYDNFKKILGIQNLSPSELNNNQVKIINDIKLKIDKQRVMTDEKVEKSNRDEINLKNDRWIITFKEGPTIKNRTFNFSEIEALGFRHEAKLYIINELKRKSVKNILTLHLSTECFNFLYRRRVECNSCANIDEGDICALNDFLQNDLGVRGTAKKRSVNTVRKMIGEVKKISDYIMIYGERVGCKTIIPQKNAMEGIRFRNTYEMTKKTDIIPDIILEQIEYYKEELSEEHRLIFDIFMNTGMRLKSVMKLKYDCLKPSRYENVCIIKYNPFKVQNYKKKKAEGIYEELIISSELASKIHRQIDRTTNLREEYNLDEIFIKVYKESGKTRPIYMAGASFSDAINRIIKRHNIIDYNGELWRFKTRQTRKTLVYLMKENGATDAELAYVLGHHKKQTLELWYKEINEQKLENLNHEFFKKRFNIDIGEEQLKEFSEAEKKCLYIDFITNYRRVPLGYCCKRLKSGECNNMCESRACEKCKKMITGRAFLQEWEKLRTDRLREVKELVRYYEEKNIDENEYMEFKEYNSLIYDIKLYEFVIKKIELGGNYEG